MSNTLTLKTVNDLLGEHFFIPHYQRGYRWTPQQITDLLSDIWAFYNESKKGNKGHEFYCLQPIVTKPRQWSENGKLMNGWEVIDGQQRLTTIHIILNYLTRNLKIESIKEEYGKGVFSVRYETRPGSAEYLMNITDDISNIDLYHITKAYQTVMDWFTNGENTKDRNDRSHFLDTILGKKDDWLSVQVIWYTVDANINGVELFTRLNIGKIPLTNAELVKALFLASKNGVEVDPRDERMKLEIAQIWDEIEQKLGEDAFWAFITNRDTNDYPTKIEILLDLRANKRSNEIDPYYTFLYFLKEKNDARKGNLWDLWRRVEGYYLTLRQWFNDKDYYHKVGYLIATGESLKSLIDLSSKIKKTDFEIELTNKIRDRVKFPIDELRYDVGESHRQKIEDILLLFNVESTRILKNNTEFYPFHLHKKNLWSLEHIHAQNPEDITQTKKEAWMAWMSAHRKVIEDMVYNKKNDAHNWRILLEKIDGINYDSLTKEKFDSLAKEIMLIFSESSDSEWDMHTVGNLALLSHPDNASLKNAVFEVKRRAVIALDRQGSYIPICTRRVFLKYYNDHPSEQQYYFWSQEDMRAYRREIEIILKDYLLFESNSK